MIIDEPALINEPICDVISESMNVLGHLSQPAIANAHHYDCYFLDIIRMSLHESQFTVSWQLPFLLPHNMLGGPFVPVSVNFPSWQ